MGKFSVTVTKVKATDTVDKFIEKIMKAKLTEASIAKYLDELDRKESAWNFEKCTEIRTYLETYEECNT